jgi:hypothetical protein
VTAARAAVATLAAVAVWLAAGPAGAGDVLTWAGRLMSGCWSCDALSTLVGIGLHFAETAFTLLAGQVATLLGLLMAIWLLLFAGGTFLPFGLDGGAGAFWNRGGRKLAQFALVLGLLQGSHALWGYLFIPVMSAGMAFSSAVVTMTDPFEVTEGTSETGPGGERVPSYCSDRASPPEDSVDGAIGVMSRMNCSLATIQSQFGKGVLIGVAQVVGAARGGDVATLICAILGGLVLILVYFGGLVLFPIFMIDVVMRVTIVTAISPLALAAWLFQPTRRFAEKAAWQIVQAALTLVFISIVGGLAKATLAHVFSHLSLNGEAAAAKNWASLIEMLESQHTVTGQPFFIDLTTMTFYQLLGIGVILLFMLRQAGRMAADFTGAGGGDFSGALAGVASAAGATGMAVDMVANRQGGGTDARRLMAVEDKAAQVAGTAGDGGP